MSIAAGTNGNIVIARRSEDKNFQISELGSFNTITDVVTDIEEEDLTGLAVGTSNELLVS